MTQVHMKDSSIFNIDTDDTSNARSVVEYKLRNRLDYRCIDKTVVIRGANLDPTSKYYNSGDQFDDVPLKACEGWSYAWGFGFTSSSAEFR